MCGLVGMAGNLIAKHDKVLKHLLIVDSLRGEDSTGLAAVGKFDNTVRVAKHLGDPFQLFGTKAYENAMSKINKVFIGHNRYATSGAVNRNNAHPFEFDTLVGVHNGTLSSKNKLDDHEQFRVDSEALYHNIEKHGVDEAIRNLGGYGNAWALVWWDKVNNTLNFLRNEERPLYMCRSKDGEALFWASESWMLITQLMRNDIKHGDVFLLDPDKLHSIKIDDTGKMSKPVVRTVKAPKPVYYVQNTTDSNVTPINQVKQHDVKKHGVTAYGASYDSDYLKAKAVTFEVLGKMRDQNGSEFMSCFDAEHPFEEVRLYMRKDDKFEEWEGGLIKGDIGSWCEYANTGKGYYKISPWTVTLDTHPSDIAMTTEPCLYPTHDGSFLAKKDWELKYRDCAWCSSPLVAEENNEFTTGGQCLCPACAKDAANIEAQGIRLMH